MLRKLILLYSNETMFKMWQMGYSLWNLCILWILFQMKNDWLCKCKHKIEEHYDDWAGNQCGICYSCASYEPMSNLEYLENKSCMDIDVMVGQVNQLSSQQK